jgi:hypothetical protein
MAEDKKEATSIEELQKKIAELEADKKASNEKEEAFKAQITEQAEKLAVADKAKSITQPVVSHGKGKEQVTVQVNLRKFKHLDKEAGMWVTKTLADLQNTQTGGELVAELLRMGSNVVSLIK